MVNNRFTDDPNAHDLRFCSVFFVRCGLCAAIGEQSRRVRNHQVNGQRGFTNAFKPAAPSIMAR